MYLAHWPWLVDDCPLLEVVEDFCRKGILVAFHNLIYHDIELCGKSCHISASTSVLVKVASPIVVRQYLSLYYISGPAARQ